MGSWARAFACHAACFLRVRAAFFADAERSEAGLCADASPPMRPPFREGE
jgi:hypothetical protein